MVRGVPGDMVNGQGSGPQRGTYLVDSNSGYITIYLDVSGFQPRGCPYGVHWLKSAQSPGQVNLAQHFSVAQSLRKSGSRLVTQVRLITDLPYNVTLWNRRSGTSPTSPSCSLLLHTCCFLVRVPRVSKQDFSGF